MISLKPFFTSIVTLSLVQKGDVEDPRGGVRHSVVGNGYY